MGFLSPKRISLSATSGRKVSHLKHTGERFDCVFVDPPFFAATGKGVVDLACDSKRLINKVRPLVNDGGHLVVANNALFLSGKAYMEALESICADGYVRVDALIPVPDDFAGYASGGGTAITDPAPFNHSTKIAVLAITRKN